MGKVWGGCGRPERRAVVGLRGRAGGALRGLAPLPPAAALAVFFGADQHQLARGRANSLRKMGRPAISEDDLATLLVVGEVSIGVRLGAALSTASPCSSTKPLQSPLFADVPALNTAPAVAQHNQHWQRQHYFISAETSNGLSHF